MSSSDSSSEDEEEKTRINEAVLGVGTNLYHGNTTVESTSKDLNCKRKENHRKKIKVSPFIPAGTDVSKLKSNRPQDKNEIVDDNPLLQTTPEFRSYVAKQLTQLLDRDLSECIVEEVWVLHLRGQNRVHKGVKLFSNSKRLCQLKDNTAPQKKAKPAKKRKINLSSSSESSDDEDINSCVFTVSDIAQENETLARLAGNSGPQSVENKDNKTKSQKKDNNVPLVEDESALLLSKEDSALESTLSKKKKKKKKRKKESDNL